MLIVVAALFGAVGLVAQIPYVQVGTDLPCGVDVEVTVVGHGFSCLGVPVVSPSVNTAFPYQPVLVPVPLNSKVYEMDISYQGVSIWSYNCAHPWSIVYEQELLPGPCQQVPGVNTVIIRGDAGLDGPDNWNYEYKIEVVMAP